MTLPQEPIPAKFKNVGASCCCCQNIYLGDGQMPMYHVEGGRQGLFANPAGHSFVRRVTPMSGIPGFVMNPAINAPRSSIDLYNKRIWFLQGITTTSPRQLWWYDLDLKKITKGLQSPLQFGGGANPPTTKIRGILADGRNERILYWSWSRHQNIPPSINEIAVYQLRSVNYDGTNDVQLYEQDVNAMLTTEEQNHISGPNGGLLPPIFDSAGMAYDYRFNTLYHWYFYSSLGPGLHGSGMPGGTLRALVKFFRLDLGTGTCDFILSRDPAVEFGVGGGGGGSINPGGFDIGISNNQMFWTEDARPFDSVGDGQMVQQRCLRAPLGSASVTNFLNINYFQSVVNTTTNGRFFQIHYSEKWNRVFFETEQFGLAPSGNGRAYRINSCKIDGSDIYTHLGTNNVTGIIDLETKDPRSVFPPSNVTWRVYLGCGYEELGVKYVGP